MIALRFNKQAHILRVAKLLGLVKPDATEIAAANSFPFTPTQELLDTLGLTTSPDVEAILGRTFWLRLSLIAVEHWATGETTTVINEAGKPEQIPVTEPVMHRVNVDPVNAPEAVVTFLKTALGDLVIDDATLVAQRGRILRW